MFASQGRPDESDVHLRHENMKGDWNFTPSVCPPRTPRRILSRSYAGYKKFLVSETMVLKGLGKNYGDRVGRESID